MVLVPLDLSDLKIRSGQRIHKQPLTESCSGVGRKVKTGPFKRQSLGMG